MKRWYRDGWARCATAGALATALLVPLAASAQNADQPLPSYARPSYASDEETISGRIASIPGKYDIEVQDDRGFIDHVQLHDGTIINPTGIRLAAGMSVKIAGYNRGKTFAANQIDTPYTSYPAFAVAPAYPVYPVYPLYPAYGYGPYWGGYWGPSINLNFGWGGYYGGWGRGWGGWRR